MLLLFQMKAGCCEITSYDFDYFSIIFFCLGCNLSNELLKSNKQIVNQQANIRGNLQAVRISIMLMTYIIIAGEVDSQ